MRRSAAIARIALALCAGACGGRARVAPAAAAPGGGTPQPARLAPAPAAAAAAAAAPNESADAPRYAATDRGERVAGADRSSRGSPKVGDFVRARQPQLQFCYGEARAHNASLTGSATIGVTLADDGTVTNAEIQRRSWSGRGGKEIERCLLSTVRAWRFPPVSPQDPHVHSFSVIFSR